MSELVQNTRVKIWEFRMAILWFCLFSINALCSCMIAALTGAKWETLDFQSKKLKKIHAITLKNIIQVEVHFMLLRELKPIIITLVLAFLFSNQ